MAIPSSSAPVARTFLHDQLTAQLIPDPLSKSSSLLVCYDDPGPNQPDDIVSVGKIHRRIAVNSMVGSGGAGWLEESYTVEVLIDVFRGGDSDQVAFTRASLLCDSVVALVRSDPSLGNSVVVAKPTSDVIEVEWDADHLGKRATATVEISCYQRI